MLMKRRPGCTGMFWRPDPTGKTKLTSRTDNWPRDGATLRGEVVTVAAADKNNNTGEEKWLLASEVRQAGEVEWKPAPRGAAMPFEYDDHYYLAPAATADADQAP